MTLRSPRFSRLTVLILLGLVAIGISLGVRNSSWVQERRLRTLSLEELALAIHDSPNDPLTFIYYGSRLLEAGNLEGSERAFQHAVRLKPKMVRAHLGLASVRLRRGNLEEAKASFERVAELDPREPAAFLGLAQTHQRAGSPKRAIEPLKKLVALRPNDALAWYSLGKMYGDARQSDLALEALRRAAQLDPEKADFWRDLGRLSQHYSLLQDAEGHYKRALQLNPNDPVTHYWLGQLYLAMGDTPRLQSDAEAALLSAARQDPEMAEAYFELGRLYERRGNWQRAATNYRKVRDLDLSDDKALYHLGRCLVKLGDTAEGEKLIRAAQALAAAKREISTLENRIRAEPQTRPLRLRMARLYRKYENHPDALNQYQVYQRMGPNDPDVAREVAAYEEALKRDHALAEGMQAAQP